MGEALAEHPDRAAAPGRSSPAPALGLAALLDLMAVTVFVLAGRRSHGESEGLAGIWTTAWPFLAGLAAGYLCLLLFLVRWQPASRPGGAVVAGGTVVLGLALRAAIQHDGVPLSFAIVTTVVLGTLILGWRVVTSRIAARR